MDNCSICFDSLKEKLQIRTTCNHVFHLHCICVWLMNKSSCPLCRNFTNAKDLKYAENSSEEVQMAAVQEDGWAIKYIKNPSKEVQIAAVKKDSIMLEYLKNTLKKDQLAFF